MEPFRALTFSSSTLPESRRLMLPEVLETAFTVLTSVQRMMLPVVCTSRLSARTMEEVFD